MLAFRRIPTGALRCGQRNFFPFLGLRSLFDELDHSSAVVPHVSVKAAKDHVALEFEVPRFKIDELKITTRNGCLTVSGKKTPPSNTTDYQQHLYGDAPASTFARSFAIPREYDLARVKTDLDHGVLTVSIPKLQAEPTKPQKENASPPAESAESNQGKDEKRESDLQVESTSKTPTLIESLSRMSWPPKVRATDNEKGLQFTVSLPEGVTRENLDLKLHGRHLNVNVQHAQRVEKKNQKGDVVFSEEQSMSYSTPVVVPEGTRASDISTSLEKGTLTITVAKQEAPQQTIKVN